MKTYNPKDYSQIYPPSKTPTKIGWYPAFYFENEAGRAHIEPIEPTSQHWFNHTMYWWDGMMWCYFECKIAFHDQNFYWFGLRKEMK